jgi:murein DD-endopeptidase MepM/ murein hydrolase activator NlpD
MTSPTWGRISQGYHFWHKALDIVNKYKTPIYAPQAGTVTHVGQMGSGVSNAGLVVQIGNPTSNAHRLCHLDSFVVKKGQAVRQGQLVGYMGYTGFTIPSGIGGTHLHWVMFRKGVRVDPRKFVTIPSSAPSPPPKFKMPKVGSKIQLIPKDRRGTFVAGTTRVAGTINVTDNTFIYTVRGYDKKYPNRIIINSASAGGNGVALALYYTNGKKIEKWRAI